MKSDMLRTGREYDEREMWEGTLRGEREVVGRRGSEEAVGFDGFVLTGVLGSSSCWAEDDADEDEEEDRASSLLDSVSERSEREAPTSLEERSL